MSRLATRVVSCVLTAVVAAGCRGGCAAPARPNAWRNRGDPAPAPEKTSPAAPFLAKEKARLEAARHRADTLRIHLDAAPDRLVPLIDPSVETLRVAQGTIFETLIGYLPPAGGAAAGPGRYVPRLARAWHIAPDGLAIAIDLRRGVRFHDGRPFTSMDAQFSIDAARNRRGVPRELRWELRDVTAVDLAGPHGLKIQLRRPDAYVLRALAEIPMLPAHAYQPRRALRSATGPVIGTGPYRLVGRGGGVIRLQRFPRYWGAAPAIARIEFVIDPDAASALTAARSGDIDIIPALIPAHYPSQAKQAAVTARFAPIRLRPAAFRYLAVNTTEPPFDDVRVRHAVALLIDRRAIATQVRHRLARAVAGPIWPGGPGNGVSPPPPPCDPKAAAALLADAGWQLGPRGRVRKRGSRRLTVSLLATAADAAERKIVLDALEQAGFVVEVRVGTPAVLKNRLRAGRFEMAFVAWRGRVDRDLSALLGKGGPLNYGRFSDPRVARILAELRGAWKPAERAPAMAELARAFADTWPVIPLTAPAPYGLISRRVRGAVVWNGWLRLPALSLAPAR